MRSAIATLAILPAIALGAPPKAIEFWRYSDGSRGQTVDFGLGPVELPAHYHTPADAGSFIFPMPSARRPAGTTTQWLSFDFLSDGLFTASPNSHIAIPMRWEGTARWNRGHGIIFGRAGRGAPNDAARAQVETWWRTGETTASNWVSPSYGGPMYDRVVYSVAIHVADGGHLAYQITDQTGAVIAAQYEYLGGVNPETGVIDSADIAGLAFALVFANSGEFTASFFNIRTGWF